MNSFVLKGTISEICLQLRAMQLYEQHIREISVAERIQRIKNAVAKQFGVERYEDLFERR